MNEKLYKARYQAKYFAARLPELLLPRAPGVKFLQRRYEALYRRLPASVKKDVIRRVDYYNQLSSTYTLERSTSIKGFKDKSSSRYYVDLNRYLRAWEGDRQFQYLYGDIRDVPSGPSFVKSRPIVEQNANSVILKLDQLRHYYYQPDFLEWHQKKDSAVWRGVCHREHRQSFVAKFFDHPLCDVGGTGDEGNKKHLKPFMSIQEQLGHKFVLSVEGHDVATNLKWIMASNSLCMMAKPKFETWYMEGTLEDGVHYVQLKDDYSDLEEKIAFYLSRPAQALEIIENAKRYWSKFYLAQQENMISYLVMKKYFGFAS